MIRQISALSCVLWFLGALHAGEPAPVTRVVSVTGTAVTQVEPDVVVWYVHVRRTDVELAKASASCDEAVKRVLTLAKELQVAPEDLQTGRLAIQKVFHRDAQGNATTFRHFQVERSITIRQRETQRFDEASAKLAAMTDLEANNTLESSKLHELRATTRLEAVKAARQKAAAMTELLGGKLGRVVRISEPTDAGPLGAWSGTENTMFRMPRAALPDQQQGTFAPGSIEVRVSVEAAFEIE